MTWKELKDKADELEIADSAEVFIEDVTSGILDKVIFIEKDSDNDMRIYLA